MDDLAPLPPDSVPVAGYFAGEAFCGEPGRQEGRAGPARRRPTLRDADRLTDALRVTRAVLRRVASGEQDSVEIEALRSAIAAADAALGGAA